MPQRFGKAVEERPLPRSGLELPSGVAFADSAGGGIGRGSVRTPGRAVLGEAGQRETKKGRDLL